MREWLAAVVERVRNEYGPACQEWSDNERLEAQQLDGGRHEELTACLIEEVERLQEELDRLNAMCSQSVMRKFVEIREKYEELAASLSQLVDAAEVYAAEQSGAIDRRCGLVQPVTVEECLALNAALLNAGRVLSQVPKGGESNGK